MSITPKYVFSIISTSSDVNSSKSDGLPPFMRKIPYAITSAVDDSTADWRKLWRYRFNPNP